MIETLVLIWLYLMVGALFIALYGQEKSLFMRWMLFLFWPVIIFLVIIIVALVPLAIFISFIKEGLENG